MNLKIVSQIDPSSYFATILQDVILQCDHSCHGSLFETTKRAPRESNSLAVDDIHGDVLEEILCHVALVDLIPASHVSRAWNVAVSSSLRNFNQLKPWLIVQTQSSRAPYNTSSRAYDPRSRVWIDIEHSPIEYVSALRSSHSKLLYMFSPSKLSYSTDPFHQKWNHVDAPVFWRTDPIVAVIGNRIVVAGGTCDFEEDPLAVEVYDFETCKWSTCESMPVILKDSAASTWLSIATNNENLIVSEKHTGLTHSFDPVTIKWNGPYNLRPDPKIFYSVIGFSDDRLILIGLIGDVEEVEGVKVWEVDSDLFVCKQIGEMDVKFVKKLKSEAFQLSSIGVCMSGNMAYVFNPLKVEEVFICEFVNGGCRWGTVEKMNVEERNSSERSVLTCAKIGMEELERAMRIDNLKFTVKKY